MKMFMKRKKMLIAIISILSIIILYKIDGVRNSISEILLSEKYKKYTYLSNYKSLGNYKIEKVVEGRIDKVMYNIKNNEFLVKTFQESVPDYTLWKIDKHGVPVDSFSAHEELMLAGIFFFDSTYIDWILTGDKEEKKYNEVINYDTLASNTFDNYLHEAEGIAFDKDYDTKEGKCYVLIEEGWKVITSKKLFEEIEYDYDKKCYALENRDVSDRAVLTILKNKIIPFHDWNDNTNIVFKTHFQRKSHQSASFYDVNNTSRAGWNGVGYFKLQYNDELIPFKSYAFQRASFFGLIEDGSFSPDIYVYTTDDFGLDLCFIQQNFVRGFKRRYEELGLFVVKGK